MSRRATPRHRFTPRFVVGLGNPGSRYEGTRHNVGAAAVNRLAGRCDARFRYSLIRGAWIAKVRVPGGEITTLARPDAFMNESGPAVARLSAHLGGERPLLVSDDLDLELGTLRFRTGGSAGGHRGVASVIAALGTDGFPRLRIGIGRPARKADVTDYVLSRFSPQEHDLLEQTLERAAGALRIAITVGLDRAMADHSQ